MLWLAMDHLFRWLPLWIADGPTQMAADEVLLGAAQAGVATIRFYRWSPPTLSLGYFQAAEDRLRDPQAAALPWVRRTTGGGAILHGEDLTYAMALPPALAQTLSPADWHCRIHRAMTTALQRRSFPARMADGCRLQARQLPFRCFDHAQPGDVVLGDAKIIGGAQRLRGGALLQHGSLFGPAAAWSPDDWLQALAEQLNWSMAPAEWSADERAEIARLAASRYRSAAWNHKR